MKKTIAILLAALTLCGFSACRGEGETASGGAGETLGKYDFYDYDLSEYVEPGVFKGIEVPAAEIAVTDEEVIETVHEFLLNNNALEKAPVTDRPVQKGDFVNIDFEGLRDGVPFEGGTAQGYDGLEIGAGQFIPGFEDGLIGVEIGQTVSLDLNFPDPYPNNPDLAGVPVVFTVKVNSLQAYAYPEITDEYVAANFGDYDSAEAFLADVRADNETNKKWTAVRERLLGGAKVLKYPQKEIDSFKKEITDNYQKYADAYGLTLESFVQQYMSMTYETFMQQAEEYAQGEVKTQMVCVALARREGIELSEEEFNDYVTFYAKQYNCASNEECLQKYGRSNITIWGLVDTVIQTAVDSAVVK